MRKLKRSIARSLMQSAGVQQMNKKKHSVIDNRQTRFSRQTNGYRKTSFFALHWRDWVNSYCGVAQA